MGLSDDVKERAENIVNSDEYEERFFEIVENNGGIENVSDDTLANTLEEEFVDENNTLPHENIPAPMVELIRSTIQVETRKKYVRELKQYLFEENRSLHNQLEREGKFDILKK